MKFTLTLLLLAILQFAFAQKNYTIVFLNKKSDAAKLTPEESKQIMDGHMANMGRLAKEGKLLAAGPFDGGGGLFIMNSTTRAEVEQWISTDPGVKAQRWNIEILPYTPRIGGICPVGEKYEMTNYSFVRYDAIVSKFTASNSAEIFSKHNDYLKKITSTGNVITEAIFGDRDGGILVLNGDVDKDVINQDPGIQEGLIECQIKKLYIAKGSFCETK